MTGRRPGGADCSKAKDFRPGSIAALALFCLALGLVPAGAAAEGLDSECALRLVEAGEDTMTLAEIRERCRLTEVREGAPAAMSPDPSDPQTAENETADSETADPASTGARPVQKRLAAEREAAARPFSILSHRPNYFLAAAYNAEGWSAEPFSDISGKPDIMFDDVEAQFQISLKVPLWIGLFDDRMDIYGGYTNRSFWQMYNSEYSEPFRETNHEPELWLQFQNDWRIGGWTNTVNAVGWNHQSNGRSSELSRSWNRLYATFLFERGAWALAFKPWIWVSRDRAESDNPDIDDYMGHGEFRTVYARNGHVFSGMLRNQLESGFDRGAVELSWSFPVFDYPYLKGYVQYFYGYGESLIDYNRKVNRLGIGISITDWVD